MMPSLRAVSPVKVSTGQKHSIPPPASTTLQLTQQKTTLLHGREEVFRGEREYEEAIANTLLSHESHGLLGK